MKFQASILALYMMVLFLMPCVDSADNEFYAGDVHLANGMHQHDHDHADQTDLCSPFCLCGCCGTISGVVLYWNTPNVSENKSFEITKPLLAYRFVSVSLYFDKIWQPPKISV